MNNQEIILKMIKRSGSRGLTVREIVNHTNMPRQIVVEILETLCNRLQLKRVAGDKFISREDNKHFAGRLAMSDKKFGFLIPNDVEAIKYLKKNSKSAKNPDRVFIAPNKLNGALHEDIILVELYEVDGKIFGEVIDHIPTTKRHVGTIYKKRIEKKDYYYVKMDTKKYPFPVRIQNTVGALEDYKVVVLIDPEQKDGEYYGTIAAVLGHKDDPDIDILSLMEEYELPHGISRKVKKELEQIPDHVFPSELEGRRDLRNETIVTIDGKNAKDLDDAISISKLENGNYLLGVHIADVEHYVKEGSEIDKEARRRGNSFYAADFVEPMLPHQLSNGICSLTEGEIRLTISDFMEITPTGKIVDYKTEKSYISSKKRMNYDDVNKVLQGDIVSGYEPFVEDINLMAELSDVCKEYRIKRGAITFDQHEINIHRDEFGKPVVLDCINRNKAEELIESFMLAANEATAQMFYDINSEQILYRIHEAPDRDRLEQLNKNLAPLNCQLNLPVVDRPIYPNEIQKFLDCYKQHPMYFIISRMTLQAMKQAKYSSSSEIHFGLAEPKGRYLHETAPIRRYEDILIQRKKVAIIDNTYDYFNSNQEELYRLGVHLSERERKTVECERAVNKMKAAEYMETQKISQPEKTYEVVITSMDAKQLYVELKNLIQGVVKIADEQKIANKKNFTYVSPEAKYKLGSEITVNLIRADKKTGTVEFGFVEDEKIYKKEK